MFVILAPFDNEQSDLIYRINLDQNIGKIPLLKEFIKIFITNELIKWTSVDSYFGPPLKQSNVFNQSTEEGQARYATLHQRVTEHVNIFNVRIFALSQSITSKSH